MYRDAVYHGGIREVGLIGQLTSKRFNAHYNRKYGITENLLKNTGQHPLDDEYWQNKRPDLSKIAVPALICASWSDQDCTHEALLRGIKQSDLNISGYIHMAGENGKLIIAAKHWNYRKSSLIIS